jgi:EAL domain-containing protein (putative c-di-GMP-specific phosphodiesterase class I)
VPPAEFIPLAEHAGLIKPLTAWVLHEALKQGHAWHAARTPVTVAVNISARSLHDPELVRHVADQLARWDLPAHMLEVEITEGALMVDPPRALETVSKLHEMGVLISIDDFGTGYSSLGYLKRLPVDQIKIDQSFVTDMSINEDDAFIVRYVIDLGHSLGLEVVAEGIETQETYDLLDTMGCDVAQGSLIGRPMSPQQLEELLTRGSGADVMGAEVV